MRPGARARRRGPCRCESSPGRNCRLPEAPARRRRSDYYGSKYDDGRGELSYAIYAPCLVGSRWSLVVGKPSERLTTNDQRLPLVIKPKLYRDFASRIIRRQRAEGINALDRTRGREVERRYTARLFDRHIHRVPIARDIKRQIHPSPFRDPRVDFILQPVLGYFPLHALDIPRKPVAEITTASREAKSALGPASAHGVGAADRTALAIRNLIRLGWVWLRLALRRAFSRRGFYLGLRVLFGNRNRFRFFLLNPGLL